MTREGWPGPVRNLAELRALAEQLCADFQTAEGEKKGEWFWNGYSCIMASVPKGHPYDDSTTEEECREWYKDDPKGLEYCLWEAQDPNGFAVPISISQIPKHEGHGDELHHPIPRRVAMFVEELSPAFVIQLIDGTANKHFDEALFEENEFLSKRLAQAEMWITHYRNELREKEKADG